MSHTPIYNSKLPDTACHANSLCVSAIVLQFVGVCVSQDDKLQSVGSVQVTLLPGLIPKPHFIPLESSMFMTHNVDNGIIIALRYHQASSFVFIFTYAFPKHVTSSRRQQH